MKTDFVASWVVLVVGGAYALAAWLVQMHRVAPPRDWLQQRIWYLQTLIVSGRWPKGSADWPAIEEVQKTVAKRWICVPISKVQAGWRNIHGFEDLHLLDLPPERVDAQLKTARTRLAAVPGPEAAGFVGRIDAALKATPALTPAARAALLREAEIFRHNLSDSKYEDLASLLGKAVWLTVVALGIAVGLAVFFDRESFLLLGAAGGLISRLSRVLQRRPTASDYGAEWSTLILSPAAGALAGWVGVAITVALASEPFNVFTDKFAKPWDDATLPLGLLVAFVFGFSERLFNRLLDVAQTQVGGQLPQENAPVT